MPRYAVRKPVKAVMDDDWRDEPMRPELVVELVEPRPTGIYDRHGDEYVELPERIGFVTRDG